jgi:hypothetical protein
MTHKKIAKSCERKLEKDAKHYEKEAHEARRMESALKHAEPKKHGKKHKK